MAIPDTAFLRQPAHILGLVLLLVAAAQQASARTLEELLNEPYFDAGDVKKVRTGQFGVAKIHEVSERELAVVIACRTNETSEKALAPFLGDTLPVDENHLRDQGVIDPDAPAASFAGILLGEDSPDEIQHYLQARPGIGLNLSSEEIEAFRTLQGTDAPRAAEALLEEILHNRYMAYREAGLAGAIPYARDNGEQVKPGEELRKTEEAMTGLHEIYPEFHDAWLSYPVNLPDDVVQDDYFWLKLDIEGRPAFVLSHRLVARNEDMHLVGIRDYYVSHFFDVSQRAAVVAPIDTGEDILIYIERAWVDYWSGMASLKKKIGRKVLLKQMEHLLEDHGICGK